MFGSVRPLSSELADSLRDLLEDYLDGWPGTLIVVTHDRNVAEVAQRIVTLVDGRELTGRVLAVADADDEVELELTDKGRTSRRTLVLADVRRVMQTTDQTLGHTDTNLTSLALRLDQSLINLANLTSNLNAQVERNTNLLSEISSAIVNTDSLVQGLKHHWLLRSAFKEKPLAKPPAKPIK